MSFSFLGIVYHSWTGTALFHDSLQGISDAEAILSRTNPTPALHIAKGSSINVLFCSRGIMASSIQLALAHQLKKGRRVCFSTMMSTSTVRLEMIYVDIVLCD